jgi:hypothetical protein
VKLSEHEPSNRRSVLRTLPRPSPNPAALLLYSLRDALVKAPKSSAFTRLFLVQRDVVSESIGCLLFDRLDVGIRQPEMMADLMDENVGHDFVQRILAVAPEVEQRPTVEPDHVG